MEGMTEIRIHNLTLNDGYVIFRNINPFLNDPTYINEVSRTAPHLFRQQRYIPHF